MPQSEVFAARNGDARRRTRHLPVSYTHLIITTMTAVIVATQFAGLFVPLDSAETSNQVIAKLFPAGYYLSLIHI